MKKAQTLLEYILVLILLMILTVAFVVKFNFKSVEQNASFGFNEEGRMAIPYMTD